MSDFPLNKTTAAQAIRLFDYCFKMGVIDACELGDDYVASSWLEERLADRKYGLLSDYEAEFDWKRWRFTLFRWCRNCSLRQLGENYIDRIRKSSNFLFGILPICMRFYLMGVQEWLDYPNPTNMMIFKMTARIHWKPVTQNLRTMKTDDFISYIQEFIYERVDNPLEDDVSISYLNGFCVAMWKLTRKYIPYGEFREGFEAEEDL